MTDSGQPPKPTPSVPPWPPTPDPTNPPPQATPPPPDAAATIRLLPVPPPATPPPPIASITTPPRIPGERYIGKYRVKGELGRGGMGAVYLAEQPGLGREVAIKELLQAADPVALRRFLQEAQAMARTSPPSLVQVHDRRVVGNVDDLVLETV